MDFCKKPVEGALWLALGGFGGEMWVPWSVLDDLEVEDERWELMVDVLK